MRDRPTEPVPRPGGRLRAGRRSPGLRVAFYCGRVGGIVALRDCAYCRAFKEGAKAFGAVVECRQESLVAGYECRRCKTFLLPQITLDSQGRPACGHCQMNGRSVPPSASSTN
ncbi:MAG: hypothetical protein HY815_18580 [Candidatus Riflebacteria bacterium]|nr:hypothetical protein [Candidatus Riflebacteria bacterium]